MYGIYVLNMHMTFSTVMLYYSPYCFRFLFLYSNNKLSTLFSKYVFIYTYNYDRSHCFLL